MLSLPGLALAVSLITGSAPAQSELTINPAMTKGPDAARVTILEFSDYQ